MSRYLIQQIEQIENIEVRTCTEVVEGAGDGHLETADAARQRHRRRRRRSTPAGCSCSSAPPRAPTGWTARWPRDERGFVLAGPDLLVDGSRPAGWPLERDPYHLETSVPGVFVAGDVRAESVKRVASAVGEGAMAVTLVHRYLEKLMNAPLDRRATPTSCATPVPVREA